MSTATRERKKERLELARYNPRTTRELIIERVNRAIREAVATLPNDVIEHALIAETDAIALFEVATRPETIELVSVDDPLAEARARGRLAIEKLIRMNGGCGTIKDVMEKLGISKQAIEKRRRKGQLISIDTGKKGILYPLWQFHESKFSVLDGLEEILKKLDERGCIGWSVFSFFLNPSVDLNGKSPLEALKQGLQDEVLSAADNYGEMGR